MRHLLFDDATYEELAVEVEKWVGNDAKNAVFVYESAEGRLQGMIEVSIRAYAEGCYTGRVGYIEGWYVNADVRQQGVGRALVEAAENWAIAQGCTEMGSDAVLDNLLSQKAHGQVGYKEVVRIVCFRKDLKRE
jgi:aminoglycoside 6'-N-acetyltransferase I